MIVYNNCREMFLGVTNSNDSSLGRVLANGRYLLNIYVKILKTICFRILWSHKSKVGFLLFRVFDSWKGKSTQFSILWDHVIIGNALYEHLIAVIPVYIDSFPTSYYYYFIKRFVIEYHLEVLIIVLLEMVKSSVGRSLNVKCSELRLTIPNID